MHSVRLEPTRLILVGTRTFYQTTGDYVPISTIRCVVHARVFVLAAAAAGVRYFFQREQQQSEVLSSDVEAGMGREKSA